MRELDLFDKLSDPTLQTSTKSGRVVSAVFLMFAVTLVMAQVAALTRPEIYRDLAIDPGIVDTGEIVNISVSVLVSMPCFLLHMDVMDSLGHRELQLNTTVTFRRVDRSGKLMDAARLSPHDKCRPCYGLLEEGQCCPSCEMLVSLAKKQNRPVEIEKWEQCGGLPSSKKWKSEKCLVKGKVSVHRVRGGFHIAPGRNLEGVGGHVHQLTEKLRVFDMSHRIDRIRFGPKIPTVVQPLEKLDMVFGQGAVVQSTYHLMATPVVYMKDGRVVERGFEYQAMSTHRRLMMMFGGVPGIFFAYKFSPYTVMVHATTKSPLMALSGTAAVLSGVYALLALVEVIEQREPSKEL